LKSSPEKRIIVAGGVSSENVEEIIDVLNPYGIDISTSLESGEGVKDPIRIKDFLDKINELKKN
jgi:phosphoribosylanthranilate isomerase